LRLQGGVIKLATTNMDLNSVLEEQAKTATGLTSGLTTFQEATKRLSGQFQKIETGLLESFGPALGGLSRGLQGIMGGLGGIAQILAGIAPIIGCKIRPKEEATKTNSHVKYELVIIISPCAKLANLRIPKVKVMPMAPSA